MALRSPVLFQNQLTGMLQALPLPTHPVDSKSEKSEYAQSWFTQCGFRILGEYSTSTPSTKQTLHMRHLQRTFC